MAALASLALVSLLAAVDPSLAAAGLKDALRIASERAVQQVSAPGGFLDDPNIRIPLPGGLDGMAEGLRALGLSAQVDELETAMNRAAERAAGEATPVLVDAVRQMSVQDAAGIVQGDDTAATQYFERTTSAPLRTRFAPIVAAAMKEVGVARLYETLAARYTSAVPFASAPKLDLNGYVTDRALAGLFLVIGEEERKIRRDHAARATDLLKQVFGR
jgi:hypothetical protein